MEEKAFSGENMNCLFELLYLKNEEELTPEGRLIASERIRLGKILARKLPVKADVLVPVPESGLSFAQGYSLESNIPLVHAIRKKGPRRKTLFEKQREKILEEILFVIPELVKDKSVLLIDETVIRGITLKIVIRKLKMAEPKEIHVRILAPPMRRRCPTKIFSRSWKFIQNGINYAKYFQVDSFEFLDIELLSSFAKCTYCFGGIRV